jgi:hypothetical protein
MSHPGADTISYGAVLVKTRDLFNDTQMRHNRMNFTVAVWVQKGYIVPFKIKEQRANREVFPWFFLHQRINRRTP